MEVVATSAPLYQLWWVTGALIDALRAGGLEASVTVKRLLGHADRELRRLYAVGEEAYAGAPPIELLNNLLFYVARATSRGERIDAVRSSFRLGELLPLDDSVEQERESLSAPSVRLMRTVAAAIKEDLGRVKDALDLYTRKGGPPEELAPQVDLLKKIGDTLAVLGLGSVREQVQGELTRLTDIITRRAPAEQDTLIGIAATLIGVEDGLDDALVRLIMPPGAPAPGAETDPDFRQVTETVLRECIVNLARIKELLGHALEPTSDRAGLDAAPALARGITAGLLLLGRNRAMEVMRRIGEHVDACWVPGVLSRNDEYVDRLADAIVGIEYYMETLQAGRGDPWYMLDNAERCLVALDAMRAAVPTRPRALPRRRSPPHRPLRRLPPPRRAMRPSVARQSIRNCSRSSSRKRARRSRPSAGCIPLWAENPADRESLTRVRRAFHTLKGSGRVVGARRIGDFAWSVENLLNRVIDGTLERSSGMLGTLSEAIAVLPALVGELAGAGRGGRGPGRAGRAPRSPHRGPAAPLQAARPAQAASPEPTLVLPKARTGRPETRRMTVLPEPPPAPPEPETPVDEAWLGRPAAYAEGGDSSLQEIYQKEVQSHLEVIRAYLRHAWLAVGTHTVTEDLYRACHTLRGASRTAEIRHSIRLAEPLHKWLRRMFDHDAPFDEAGLAVLADCVVGFEDVLAGRARGTGHFTNLDRLVKRVEQQDAALERRLAEEPPQMTVTLDAAAAPPAPPPPASRRRRPRRRRSRSIRCCPAAVPACCRSATCTACCRRFPSPPASKAGRHTLRPPSRLRTAVAAEAAAQEREAAEPVARAEDYDPEVAAIFSEEATELLEAADGALTALKTDRGGRERVTELKRVLHTLKGGARMAGITAMGDLSHELESLVIQLGDDVDRLDGRLLEVAQASLDELARMRDYVGAGRPVVAARDLVTRIRLVARGGAPAPTVAAPAAPPPMVAAPPAPVAARLRRRPRRPVAAPPIRATCPDLPPEAGGARCGRSAGGPAGCAKPPPSAAKWRASTPTCSTTC